MATLTFMRRENKYLITEEQKNELIPLLLEKMNYDNHCPNGAKYLVRNVYFDTFQNDLISKSIRKPKYKEKIRIRKYGEINDKKDIYFLEVKRKVLGIVSKRRVSLHLDELNNFINNKIIPKRLNPLETQVMNEFKYIFSIYDLMPNVFLSYERLGFFEKDNPLFRLTIDDKMYTRHKDFDFDNNRMDYNVLNTGSYIMEVKVSDAMPLWFTKILSELHIYPSSFSKYGKDYENTIKRGNDL